VSLVDFAPPRDAGTPDAGTSWFTLWGRGFRPFFLLAAAYAALAVAFWLAVLGAWAAAPRWLSPSLWHAHEMLFGFVAAAIAGFLLTSVPVWTGRTPVTGLRLAALAALWIAGRAAMAAAGRLPLLAVALADASFLGALALAVALPIARSGQRRNYGFAVVVAALALANGLVHLDALGLAPGGATRGVTVGVDLVTLLVVLVGGRITPAFTANALRRAGVDTEVRSSPGADRLAFGALAVMAAVDAVWPRGVASGALAAVAAAASAWRMRGWRSARALGDPLVWSLHLGQAWVVVGLACVGASGLGLPLPWTTGVHALTAGAFGSMILAVMTRVALGHTGRPLVVPRGIAWAYGLASAGAALRVVGPLVGAAWALPALVASGLLWALAFALYLVRYARILVSPRVDGTPG
jgi:uncharacterized protein involved in response to NO